MFPIYPVYDVLCDRHRAAVDTRWRLGDVGRLLDSCWSCGPRSGAPNYTVVPHRHTRQNFGGRGDAAWLTAVHEAGHAVVGLVGGGELEVAQVNLPVDVGGSADGWVRWSRSQFALEQGLAMLWAGQQASLRHLADMPGWDTPSDRLGCMFGARGDMDEVGRIEQEYGVERDFGRRRCNQVLNRHWDVVMDLADWLFERLHIPGDEVTRRYAKALGLN